MSRELTAPQQHRSLAIWLTVWIVLAVALIIGHANGLEVGVQLVIAWTGGVASAMLWVQRRGVPALSRV